MTKKKSETPVDNQVNFNPDVQEPKQTDLPGRIANGRFIEDHQFVALLAFLETLPINQALNMYRSLSSLPQMSGVRIIDGPVQG